MHRHAFATTPSFLTRIEGRGPTQMMRGRIVHRPIFFAAVLAWAAVAPAGAEPGHGIAPSKDAKVTAVAMNDVGDVFLLRGFGDVFSRGLDQMAATLNHQGIDAEVTNHNSWRSVALEIIDRERRLGPRPVVLVGHSLGANAVIQIAELLKKEHITVQYMAIFAATGPDPVPSNVRRVDNFYFASNGWGEPVSGATDFSGSLDNRDYSNAAGIGHFNIDTQPQIQREVLAKIVRYVQP
jgi:pimeloyl-ACP methyl ester carboxylesterase